MLTKIALTAAVILGTASAALATEQDPNLANRYPGFNGPVAATVQVFHSAPVTLRTKSVALRTKSVALRTKPVALRTSKVSQSRSQAVFAKTHDREGASHDR